MIDVGEGCEIGVGAAQRVLADQPVADEREQRAQASFAVVEQLCGERQDAAPVGGEQGLFLAADQRHGNIDATGRIGDGAEDGFAQQRHVAGEQHGEVVAGDRERGFEPGQRAAVMALVSRLAPVEAGASREFLIGAADDDDLVGGDGRGRGGPMQQRAAVERAGGLVAAEPAAEAAGEDDGAEGLPLGHALPRPAPRPVRDGASLRLGRCGSAGAMASTGLPLHEALGLARPCLFATVGGGGKTTILFALAEEAAAASATAFSVITTTTKMTVPPDARRLPLVLGTDEAFRAGALDDVYRRGLPTAISGSGRGDRERVLGVDPDWPRRALDLPGVDFAGVEADGSAGRPFKAPAEHEPVIPAGVDAVAAVVGVQVLGRRLDDGSVHRPERVRALTGCAADAEITPALIAAVLAHEDGGRKGVPEGTAYVAVVSGVVRDMQGALEIAAAARARGLDRVVAFDAKDRIAERI